MEHLQPSRWRKACCCATARLPAIPESHHLCCVTELIKKRNKMGKSKEGVEKHLQGGFRFTLEDNDISKCRLFPLQCDLMQQALSHVAL